MPLYTWEHDATFCNQSDETPRTYLYVLPNINNQKKIINVIIFIYKFFYDLYVEMCISMNTYTHIWIYAISPWIRKHTYEYTPLYTWERDVCIDVHIHVCIHVYIHVFIDVYIHDYINTHMNIYHYIPESSWKLVVCEHICTNMYLRHVCVHTSINLCMYIYTYTDFCVYI